MSRTLRNYPTVYCRSAGIIYAWSKDIPKKDWWEEEEVRETYYVWDTYYAQCQKPMAYVEETNYPKRRLIPKTRWVKTGKWVLSNHWNSHPDYEYKQLFHEKTREGRTGANRTMRSYGVGKYNKQIRSRHHRAKVRHVIQGNWMQGNFDAEIEAEKNHDRYDYW